MSETAAHGHQDAATAPEVLTARQACALLQIERHALYRLVRDGRISVIRLGPRTWRFARRKLLEEITKQAEAPG